MEFPDYLRLSNALLSAVSFIAFAVRINDDWSRLTNGWRVVRLSLLGVLGALIYGSFNITFSGVALPLNLSTVLITFSVVGVLAGLWMVRAEGAPVTKGWVRASDVQAILDGVEHAHEGYEPCHNPGCIEARKQLHAFIRAAEDSPPLNR